MITFVTELSLLPIKRIIPAHFTADITGDDDGLGKEFFDAFGWIKGRGGVPINRCKVRIEDMRFLEEQERNLVASGSLESLDS